MGIPLSVVVFNWATSNNKLGISVPDAIARIDHERHLFNRIATAEGHRMLQFLDETERLVLLKVNPIFEESRHELLVKNVSGALLGLCEGLANLMNVPFERIVRKLKESSGCWVHAYIHTMKLKRLACILLPHFLRPSEKKAMLIRDRDESFSRWGLPVSDGLQSAYFEVDYFGGDIVDVELYTASRYLAKHCLPRKGLEAITSRVMTEPGMTWIEVAKAHVEKEILARRCKAREYSERALTSREDKSFRSMTVQRHCGCGQLAAKARPYDKCGDCCNGPCFRHAR